jgi:hypothetical protein
MGRGNTSLTDKGLEAERTQLRRILQEFCTELSLNGRLHSFSRLTTWSRFDGTSASVAERIGRLNELLSLLEGDVDLRVPFQKAFHAMLGETQAVGLFAEAGLHPRESLWSELARRVVERILPSAQADADLSKLVFQLHPDDRYISGFLIGRRNSLNGWCGPSRPTMTCMESAKGRSSTSSRSSRNSRSRSGFVARIPRAVSSLRCGSLPIL